MRVDLIMLMFYLDELQQVTDAHLEVFAREGLRTLCVAKRVKKYYI